MPSNLENTTLHSLKDLIDTSPLGPLRREEQRLFYLGKEIKTGNRSLETLGIGRFNVFSIHLHSLRPKVNELLSDDGDTDVEVVDVTDSNGTFAGRCGRNRKRQDEKVVDLLDSDSDDEIEILDVKENKRRRKNEITID